MESNSRAPSSSPGASASAKPKVGLDPAVSRASAVRNDPAEAPAKPKRRRPRPLPEGYIPRVAEVKDVPEIVDLMMQQAHANGGRLGDLGRNFNRLMYQHFVESPHGLIVVMEAPDGRIAAMGTGLVSRPFFRDFLLKRSFIAAWAILPYALNPKNLLRNADTVWAALRYIPRSPNNDPPAECTGMNTHGDFHRLGLGTHLFSFMVEQYKLQGYDCIKLGHIPVDNTRAIAYWESFGSYFVRTEPIYSGHLTRVYFYDLPERTLVEEMHALADAEEAGDD
ncbi:MAG: GNAT family N-acetyltransferase [Acidobacteriota bacterium]